MFGAIAALAVSAVVACAFGALIAEAGRIELLAELGRPLTRSIIRFTLWQAALSALISVALALPLARALARRGDFFGRRLLIRLSSVSLVIPSMVAVLGMVAVHGRGGWVNDALVALGFSRADYLYGLPGILLAHVFFNLPLAARIFLNELLSVPQSVWNTAALCGLRPRHLFHRIEWPLLRGLIPGAAGMVFLLCFTSFAIVLTLGGGPRSTTLEVAIYQAVRFDFDLSKAVALSLIQIALCGVLAVGFFAFGAPFPLRPGDAPGVARPDSDARLAKISDAAIIAAAAVFLLSPLAAALARAAAPGGWAIVLAGEFWSALQWTVVIAAGAGLLATACALALADLAATLRQSRRSRRGWAVAPELAGALTLLAPPITLGAGLFLFFRQFTDALSLGPALVVVLNALLALAFAARILMPAVLAQRRRVDALCAGLGVAGWNKWRLALWPNLRRPAAYALAVATTLAAGDLGVIALFGTDDLSTLPLLIYRLLGAYRVEQAAVVAAVLCALCAGFFWSIERLGAGRERHA